MVLGVEQVNGYAELSAFIRLPTVVSITARPNDLLPPRPDDWISGEAGEKFLADLVERLAGGSYQPTRGILVPVPKPGFTSRVAALLSLEDRFVLHSLIAGLLPRLEQSFLDPDVVFGPRGTGFATSWDDFERASIEASGKYVVRADIAGFYESISHGELERQLIEATNRSALVSALVDFLRRVLDSDRGVPQGLLGSDVLASAYLTPLDKHMIGEGWSYFRRGDDLRVTVNTFSSGRRAIAAIEDQLRKLGLLLNDSKTFLLKKSTYRAHIEDVSLAEARLRARLEEERSDEIQRMELDELEEFLKDHGFLPDEEVEEALWDVYHGSATVDELIDRLGDALEPEDFEVAAQLFRETIGRSPGSDDALARDVFSRRLTSSIAALAVAENPIVMPQVDKVLFRFPHLTEVTCSYLSAMLNTRHAKSAMSSVENFILRKRFRYDWQEAWLLSVLFRSTGSHSEEFSQYLTTLTSNLTDDRWLARVYAARLQARRGRLDRSSFQMMWRSAPPPLRVDLLEAAHSLRGQETWADQYLDSKQLGAVKSVVISRSQTSGPSTS